MAVNNSQSGAQKRSYFFNGTCVSRTHFYRLRKEKKNNHEEALRFRNELYAETRVLVENLRASISNANPASFTSYSEERKAPTETFDENHGLDVQLAQPQLLSPSTSPPLPTLLSSPAVCSPTACPSPTALQPQTTLECTGDVVQRQLGELHAIFSVHGATLQLQKELLRYMRNITPETQVNLPIDGRSLRPPVIAHSIRPVPPGQFVYFGIAYILNMPGINLFDKSASEIRLSLNIDGLPLYRNTNGLGFWPILGSIEQYPEFLIGAYEGRSKPTCSNNFLKDLVTEIVMLRQKGIRVGDVVYRFTLEKMLMDAPALAYITGVKGHNGYNCCTKCCIRGELVTIEGNLTKKGRPKKVLRFLDMDAPPRHTSDFDLHFDLVDEPHLAAGYVDGEKNVNYDAIDENEDEIDEQLRMLSQSEHDRILNHHKHPTLLTTIPGFDVIRDIPLDYMHLICLGVVKRILGLWTEAGPHKMRNRHLSTVSSRLLIAREFCPSEFQRKPESLQHLSGWKATQFRVFLLYVGAVVLDDILDEKYLHNFHFLVTAIRCLSRKVDRTSNRAEILRNVSNLARTLLRTFLQQAIDLYTADFAVYNAHNLIHIPDDYARFGPLDEYSCFKYESFLGRLKGFVTGRYKPLAQLINKYSSLLYTRQFGQGESRRGDHIEDYYELPKLRRPVNTADHYETAEDERRNFNNEKYEHFREMRFKNFVLRTDNKRDTHCLVGADQYVRITKILKERETNAIFIVGKFYQCTRSLFLLPDITSKDVGITVCSRLTEHYYTYHLHQIAEKCFALPLQCEKSTCEEWVLIRYLH